MNYILVDKKKLAIICVTQWTAACQASLSFTISWTLLKLMFIKLVMPFNHLLLPSSFPSIWVFPNESSCTQNLNVALTRDIIQGLFC